MNKFVNTSLLLTTVLASFAANSAFVLNGTRYIYQGDSNALSVEVTNYADRMFGGQVWVSNTTDTDDIPFTVMPSVFTLEPEQKQKLQISKLLTDSLASDRESLFWLHVQEIPTKNESDPENSNVLMLASRSNVKLIYRPESIKDNRLDAESKLLFSRKGNQLTVQNVTPYYFAVVSINGEPVTQHKPLTAFKPFTQYSLESVHNSNTLTFSAIGDWGGVREYLCDLNKVKQQCQY